MQTLEKRTSEQARYDIDCSILLTPGETITGVTSLTAEPVTTPPIVFGSPAINVSQNTYVDQYGSSRTVPAGTVVQVQISGGKIATGRQVQDYLIRALVVTNINPAVEATVRLEVNDTPDN